MSQLFSLGQVVATPGALAVLEAQEVTPATIIHRHVSGDWSDMDKEDQKSNAEAIKDGFRVFSSYNLSSDTRIWIITEADRSSTTILLPDEY